MPQKHADLIKAWADSPELVFQYRKSEAEHWQDFCLWKEPDWNIKEIRLKPEPKKDFVRHLQAFYDESVDRFVLGGTSTSALNVHVKCTFDGETRKIKAVSLMEIG